MHAHTDMPIGRHAHIWVLLSIYINTFSNKYIYINELECMCSVYVPKAENIHPYRIDALPTSSSSSSQQGN